MPKYCPRCGAQNPDNALFCSSCGYNLQSVYSPSVPSPPNQNPPPIGGQSWGYPPTYISMGISFFA
ncbi:zinc-ribbon domain-containing protein [Metallosphaera hakonensis]|uniref:Zinc-ribbon domain-containing protein n=1 Tax=Metallosphaera hakonensis JCM 8857 = DSM 7519 TaxID=1293036 RepID=A0A2U9IWJ1_9CREN|nr:zinc ribbon domain-containing protein [Metallosphaera hakonensis]AWS00375.1 zinc-ribbon domain-containing protein [Metallosphaera hakonensis JCM 8857 = DSM 7519]